MTFYKKNNRFSKFSLKSARKESVLPVDIPTHSARPAWLRKTPAQVDLVFFDLETTGGNPYNSSIIEIGAIKYSNGKEVGRFETLVNPKKFIPKIVQKITKINNEMLKNAPALEEIFDDFIEFIGDAVLVAHGAQGDVSYLVYAMKEFKQKEFLNFYFCTHLIVNQVMSEIPSKSLSGLAEYFGFPVLKAHNALFDAEMTANIFWKIVATCESQGIKSCEDFLKIQADHETLRKLGPGINAQVIENSPTTPGVLFVLNAHHQISYITASVNIKKSLQYLTEIGSDKEMNRIIVDASGFKFERCNHFLDALIQEKRSLKRLALTIDPRKTQNRSENFLQFFIPNDMLKYAKNHPEKVPFFIHHSEEAHCELLESDDFSAVDTKINSNLYVTFGETSTSIVPVTRAKKVISILKSDKFKISRHRDECHEEPFVRIGHLKEGIGYCFGPFVQPKTILLEFKKVLDQFPIEYQNYSMQERFAHLRVLIAFLSGSLPKEIEHIQKSIQKISAITNVSKLLRNIYLLKKVKHLGNIFGENNVDYSPKSGLCVISNNNFKEFDLAVVVKGRIVKKIRLPFEQAEKLKSPRYFTRCFENYYQDIISPFSPILFTDDTCCDLELFAYWLSHKKGEGEWMDFQKLQGLYDVSLI